MTEVTKNKISEHKQNLIFDLIKGVDHRMWLSQAIEFK